MWIKNSSGKKDAMLTFALISFLIVSVDILLEVLSPIFEKTLSISFSTMDTGVMTTYLSATFTAYVARKWTDRGSKKQELESEKEISNQ